MNLVDLLAKLEQILNDRLEKAENFLTHHIENKISIQGPPRSLPGNPPHKDTGKLHKDVLGFVKPPFKAQIIVTLPYAPMLEYGTSKMAPRPFMRPSIDECKADIIRIMTKG